MEVFVFRKRSGVWKTLCAGELYGEKTLILDIPLPSGIEELYVGQEIQTDGGWEMQIRRFVQTNAKPRVVQKEWEVEIQKDILRFPEGKYDTSGDLIELLGEE